MAGGRLRLPATLLQAPHSRKPSWTPSPPARQQGSLRVGCLFSGVPPPRACHSALGGWGQGLGPDWPRGLPGNPTHRPGSSSRIRGPSPPSEAVSPGGVESRESGRRGGPGPHFPAAAGPGVVSCYSLLMVSSLPKGGGKQPPFWERPSSPSPQPSAVSQSSRQVGSGCGNG